MTVLKIILFLVSGFLFLPSVCYATGFDCEKASSKVEQLICEDGSLSDLDDELNRTYTLLLNIHMKPAILKAEQKKWLVSVRNACSNEDCLEKVYEQRIAHLENEWTKRTLSINRTSVKKWSGNEKAFEGSWERCQIYKGFKICSTYTLVQNGRQVCGEWSYWATNRTYQGNLQAVVRNPYQADLKMICGDPGSETSILCENVAGQYGRWEKATGVLFICDGRLYKDQKSMPCNTVEENDGEWFHPLAKEERKRLLREKWVKDCLRGKAAPVQNK